VPPTKRLSDSHLTPDLNATLLSILVQMSLLSLWPFHALPRFAAGAIHTCCLLPPATSCNTHSQRNNNARQSPAAAGRLARKAPQRLSLPKGLPACLPACTCSSCASLSPQVQQCACRAGGCVVLCCPAACPPLADDTLLAVAAALPLLPISAFHSVTHAEKVECTIPSWGLQACMPPTVGTAVIR